MVCSCGLFHRQGITCRHIYTILAVEPVCEHFWHKHLKVYESWFGKNEWFTEKCNEKHNAKGPWIQEMGFCANTNRCSTAEGWFEEALPHMVPVVVPHSGKLQIPVSGLPVRSLTGVFDDAVDVKSKAYGKNP